MFVSISQEAIRKLDKERLKEITRQIEAQEERCVAEMQRLKDLLNQRNALRYLLNK